MPTPRGVTMDSDTAGPPTAEDTPVKRSKFRTSLPVLSMIIAVLVGAIMPVIRTPNFYFWDDTAAVAVGVWQRIAQELLGGNIPFLQIDMWRGGNFIAEAATGMWNPVMVALMLGTYPLDDIATAITITKFAFFVITAGGVYVLARGYRATPWMAALVGVVMPLSGWALFMDGSSWINGVAITAFTPWAWWAIRRSYLLKGTRWSLVLAAFFGYLLASVGNPYGMVSLAAAFMAVAIEAIMAKRVKEIWWLVGLGVALLLMSVVIYLPFLLTSSVGFRANSATYNDEFLSPNLNNLLGMSAPTFKPFIRAFGLPYMTFPGVYLAWFIVPLLPWLRWRSIGSEWRALTGVLAFGLFYLIFLLGPTQLSMFRWPARLLPFVYLAILIIVAVVASRGLHTTSRRTRTILSVAAVFAGAWMAYSDVPSIWRWHALATFVILVMGAIFLRWGNTGARGFTILAGGMLILLIPQLVIAPSNQNVANYNLPRSKSELIDRFADRYQGVTIQVADYMALGDKLNPDEAWQDLLAGNMYSVAGVESTTAYSGVGFTKLDNAMCMNYNGSTCKLTWEVLWKRPAGSDSLLADLLRAETVVALNDIVDGQPVPAGWTRVEHTPLASVFTRDLPIEFPTGRISGIGNDVTVHSDLMVGKVDEAVEVSTNGSASTTLNFARLAWPGYSATLDGQPVEIVDGPVGLLTVKLPGDVDHGVLDVTFTPPGLMAGLGLLGGGAALVGVLVFWRRKHDQGSTD